MTVSPAGRLTLAYLARTAQETSWRLYLAAVSIDKLTGKPVVSGLPAPSDEVTDSLLPWPPAFSADGQTVFAATENGLIKKCSLATLSRQTMRIKP